METSESTPIPSRSTHSPHLLVVLGLILALALGVRLVAISRPLLGNFATKNVVYAMIARNLVEHRASFWLPRIDCLRGGQRGLHLLEVPLSAYLAGGLWKCFGGSLDVWGRIVSIAFSLTSILVLYHLVRRRHGHVAGLGAAAVLALSPVAVMYGRHFMLEASIAFFAVATIDTLDRWLAGRRAIWLAASAACFALLALTKIYMLVLLLPIVAMLFRRVRLNAPEQPHDFALVRPDAPYMAFLLFLLAAVPAIAWVAYVLHAASPGGNLSDQIFYSLRDSAGAHRPPDPLLARPDFYRRLFDDWAGVVLTPAACMLPLIGLMNRAWRRWIPWLAAMALLVVAMPRKFFEMNYYWVVVLPPVAVLAGLGWARLVEKLRPSRMAMGLFLALALVASLRYTSGPLLNIPAEDRAVLPASRVVREQTAQDELVVTMHGSGIDLLYYCDRPGWALEPNDPRLADRLAECARAGAKLLAIVDVEHDASPDRAGRLPSMPLVAEGEGFRVYRLLASGSPVVSKTEPRP
ncbi:MAG TPA: glycosyltransferase family 39 protein [Thermoguttaceae bacterium]|nr:glycosyltransferase family 39 protein [Thermoguttaceae bacterium]